MSTRRQTAVNPSAFNKIMAGLKDARAYLDGERSGLTVRAIQVPTPVSRSFIVQAKLGRSQTDPHD